MSLLCSKPFKKIWTTFLDRPVEIAILRCIYILLSNMTVLLTSKGPNSGSFSSLFYFHVKCLRTKSQKEKFINPGCTVHILRETKKSFDPKVTFTNIKFLQSSLCEKTIKKQLACQKLKSLDVNCVKKSLDQNL